MKALQSLVLIGTIAYTGCTTPTPVSGIYAGANATSLSTIGVGTANDSYDIWYVVQGKMGLTHERLTFAPSKPLYPGYPYDGMLHKGKLSCGPIKIEVASADVLHVTIGEWRYVLSRFSAAAAKEALESLRQTSAIEAKLRGPFISFGGPPVPSCR